ncbi:MAG: glycoside hydrolase family 3 protein [Bacteroidia bacterium]|nr:glycoside hydrolase family 3 protein [Bacteroidia bacterium]
MYYSENKALSNKTDSVFNALNDQQRVGQMIFAAIGELGHSEEYAKNLIIRDHIGGFVLLKGSKSAHAALIDKLNAVSENKQLIKPLFSIDAEPSLYSGRMQGSFQPGQTIDIKSERASDSIAQLIAQDIKSIGIHQNYAPVIDISPNNEAIKSRSFGSDPQKVVRLSEAFVKGTQECEVIATIKHFPGHGLVSGDTHKNMVFIDGRLKEVINYRPLIEDGVLSVMVAHIIVRNNDQYDTNGLPASCSPKIVTGLLREEYGFNGLIVSDALNMQAAQEIGKPGLKASMAGCDVILMPLNEAQTINDILVEISRNSNFKEQVYESVKRILRMKICLGII